MPKRIQLLTVFFFCGFYGASCAHAPVQEPQTPPPERPPSVEPEETPEYCERWVALPVRVIFHEPNGVEFHDGFQEVLQVFVETLQGREDVVAIRLEGHAHSAENELEALGERRASVVEAHLVTLGVQQPMTITTHGDSRPVCSETAACDAVMDRRVEVSIRIRRTCEEWDEVDRRIEAGIE